MTINRWPNTRQTPRSKPERVTTEPKPWLLRRSARHAPAPTALRVEPWDSEILRTLVGEDNACQDCGHVRCSCPEQPIAPVATARITYTTEDGTTRVQHALVPAPKAGERDVPTGWLPIWNDGYNLAWAKGGERVCTHNAGSSWYRGKPSGQYAVVVGVHGTSHSTADEAFAAAENYLRARLADDGEPRVGDGYLFGIDDATHGVWTIERIEPREAWGRCPSMDMQSHTLLRDLREGLANGRYKLVTRGPVPT